MFSGVFLPKESYCRHRPEATRWARREAEMQGKQGCGGGLLFLILTSSRASTGARGEVLESTQRLVGLTAVSLAPRTALGTESTLCRLSLNWLLHILPEEHGGEGRYGNKDSRLRAGTGEKAGATYLLSWRFARSGLLGLPPPQGQVLIY